MAPSLTPAEDTGAVVVPGVVLSVLLLFCADVLCVLSVAGNVPSEGVGLPPKKKCHSVTKKSARATFDFCGGADKGMDWVDCTRRSPINKTCGRLRTILMFG